MSSLPPIKSDYLSALSLLGGTWKRYLHISFYIPPGMSQMEADHRIQPIINGSDDWMKYAPNCWIVWTPQTPEQWYAKFSADPDLKSKCSFLIMYIDLSPSNRAGQFQQWVWDWLAKVRY